MCEKYTGNYVCLETCVASSSVNAFEVVSTFESAVRCVFEEGRGCYFFSMHFSRANLFLKIKFAAFIKEKCFTYVCLKLNLCGFHRLPVTSART